MGKCLTDVTRDPDAPGKVEQHPQRSGQAALAGQRLMWVKVGHTGRLHHLNRVSKDREDLVGEENGGHQGVLAALSDLSS